MAKVRHQIGIAGEVADVFNALHQNSGLVGWWATKAEGIPEVNQILDLHFSKIVTLSFKVEALIPNTIVDLRCVSGPFSWKGSTLRFKLKQDTDQVWVQLTHENTDASEDDFLYFSTKWACYLLSLKDFIEHGKGRPYPNDTKIHVGD